MLYMLLRSEISIRVLLESSVLALYRAPVTTPTTLVLTCIAVDRFNVARKAIKSDEALATAT